MTCLPVYLHYVPACLAVRLVKNEWPQYLVPPLSTTTCAAEHSKKIKLDVEGPKKRSDKARGQNSLTQFPL